MTNALKRSCPKCASSFLKTEGCNKVFFCVHASIFPNLFCSLLRSFLGWIVWLTDAARADDLSMRRAVMLCLPVGEPSNDCQYCSLPHSSDVKTVHPRWQRIHP